MPKVDIIIPAYNAASFLPIAIESVMAQTFEDWRILIVDDGSKDNTDEVVAPYVEKLGPKIQFIKQPNSGAPAARNTALRNSTAEFLALLDADDVWVPDRLEVSLKRFDNPQVGLSYGMITRIDPDGNVLDSPPGNRKHAEGMIAPHIYTRRIQLPCPTITFRRKCVDEVGIFDETIRGTEDRDMWFRIALRYEVAFIPKVIALYRISPGAVTSDPNRMLKAQLLFIEKHANAPGCGAMARRISLSGIYKQRAEALGLRKEWLPAFRSALHAMALYPWDRATARTAVSLLARCLGIRRNTPPSQSLKSQAK